MSKRLMLGLGFFYLGLCIVALAERKYGLSVYWLGAVLINFGVLWMN